MAQQHFIRLRITPLRKNLPNLTLLREHPHPPAVQILHKPRMVDLDPVVLGAPRQAAGRAVSGRDGLLNGACEGREAEGAEFEDVALLQMRAGVRDGDGGAVFVVGLPLGDVVEQGPDGCCRDVFGDDFVGDEVVCCAGEEVRGPDDGRLGGVRNDGS